MAANRFCWFLVLALNGISLASIEFTVTIQDPEDQYAGYRDGIGSCLQAAGSLWSEYLAGDGVIDLVVRFGNIATASGGPVTSALTGYYDDYSIYESGVASEIRSGIDPNGSDFDGRITIGTSYLTNTLWFDTNPWSRTATVPSNKRDAVSTFLHELGHILAFFGWRDENNGSLPSDYMSPFDRYTVFEDGDAVFIGPAAAAEYGAPVPLTDGNIQHIGNSNGEGSDLLDDLMNGVIAPRGVRNTISELDLAILIDAGLPVYRPGDLNKDGFVDGFDMQPVLASWGLNVGADSDIADVDGNGIIDALDLQPILKYWGQQTFPDSVSVMVPSPCAAPILQLGAVLAGIRRRRPAH